MDEFGAVIRDYSNPNREADKALPVQFHYKDYQDKKTGEWKKKEYIKIWVDQWNIIDRPVRFDFDQSRPHPPDNVRWGEQYENFKKNTDQTVGTPITQIAGLTSAERAQLDATHFKTAEQVAGIPDNQLNRLGLQGRKLRDKIKSYLEAVNGEGHKLARQNAELEKKADNQAGQIEDLQQQIRELQSLAKEQVLLIQ